MDLHQQRHRGKKKSKREKQLKDMGKKRQKYPPYQTPEEQRESRTGSSRTAGKETKKRRVLRASQKKSKELR